MNLYEVEHLIDTIKKVHSQKGDDVCWMDIDLIFKAAGLEVPDRMVGDKAAMLRNCSRYIDTMCQEGQWISYEAVCAQLRHRNALIHRLLSELRKYKKDAIIANRVIGILGILGAMVIVLKIMRWCI